MISDAGAPFSDDRAAALRGFGPLGILSILVILAGNFFVAPVSAVLVLVWARRRLPVIRADRYAEVAWVVLMPLAILQALAVALVVLTTGGTP